MRAPLFASLACALSACGPTVGPLIDPLPDENAPVGLALQVPLHGHPGAVRFDFSSPDLTDLKTRALPATLTNYADGEAVFRWTPLADDVGDHEVDFVATAGAAASVLAATIHVVAGPSSPPTFREPAGDGTVLELALSSCADVAVVVDDPDSTAVTLALAPPLVANAVLTTDDPTSATLRFCPTSQQVANATIYPITFSADDGTSPPVLKPYTIVVRPAPVVSCTTAPPTIVHTPHGNITTTGNLHIVATLDDDVGVVSARTLWTTDAPPDPMNPDFSTFQVLAMAKTSGDALSGSWEAIIPNPVVSSPSGTVKTIWYAIEADDDDPPIGCAHRAFSPAMGTYSFTVKRP